MSKETREHLSALVDGEISRDTSRFLVSRLGSDEELRATWSRYHLVRDCLRHQDGAIAGEDLCSRVSLVLQGEPQGKSYRKLPVAWLKPVAGLAIAASVALMAVVAVGPGNAPAPRAAGGLASEAVPETFVSPQPQGFSAASFSSQASFSDDQKMNSYLLRHYQASGATGGKGFVTFVPIVITGSSVRAASENPEETTGPVMARDEETNPQ